MLGFNRVTNYLRQYSFRFSSNNYPQGSPFSNVNGSRGGQNKPAMRGQSNVKINHRIVDSQNLQDLMRLYHADHSSFNFINYSTMYKRLTQIKKELRGDSHSSELLKIHQGLFTKLQSDGTDYVRTASNDASRAIASLCFYLTKLTETVVADPTQQARAGDTIDPTLKSVHAILDRFGVELFSYMNDLEKANFLNSISKRQEISVISAIAPELKDSLNPQMELRSLLSIFYSLTISCGSTEKTIADLLIEIDRILTQKFTFNDKKSNPLSMISCRDFSDILYCYSKNQSIFKNSSIYRQIEEAALTDATNQSERDKIENQKKIVRLFKQDRELDPLSISTILYSIGNLEANRFQNEFYERFGNLLLLVRFRSPRQIANAIRGFTVHYTPSEAFYRLIEVQATGFLQSLQGNQFQGDLQSFSTILYSMAMAKQGSKEFYSIAENFVKQHIESFNTNQLQFIFFSWKFIQEFELQVESRDIISKRITELFQRFSKDEMVSIISNYKSFEKIPEKHETFFTAIASQLDSIDVNNLLNNSNQTSSNNNNNPLLEVLYAFFTENSSKDLSITVPKFTKECLKLVSSQNQISTDDLNKLNNIFQLNQSLIELIENINKS